MSKPWGEKNDAYEDGYQRGFADALEAAAKAATPDPDRYRSETVDQYDCDCAEVIRKLKPRVPS